MGARQTEYTQGRTCLLGWLLAAVAALTVLTGASDHHARLPTTADPARHPHAAATLGAQRVATGLHARLETPRLLMDGLGATRVSVALSQIQAHLLTAVGANRLATPAWHRVEIGAIRISDRHLQIDTLNQLANNALHIGDYPAATRHAEAMLAYPKADDAAMQDRLQQRKEAAGLGHRKELRTFVDFIDADEKRL